MATRSEPAFAIGVDFGTNSVRALLVDVRTGRELATHVYAYAGGSDGILLDRKNPNLARQRPGEYLKGVRTTIKEVVKTAPKNRGFAPDRVVGIGVDATGSTPIPVGRDGRALAEQKRFRTDPAAQAWLWKDHTAHEEAAAITETARKAGAPYLDACGGTYSSEWFWSKIWHCRKTAPAVFKAAYSWVECCDFVTAYLAGTREPDRMMRSICAAGHKAMYNDEWGGLPSEAFLSTLDPALGKLRERLYDLAVPADELAGTLDGTVAKAVGLPAGIPVAVGAFDAHMGAVGAGIRPGRMAKILGTSSCDMIVAPAGDVLQAIPGVCGVVPGSVLPGLYGIEAGQSAVGDIYNWFVKHLCPKAYTRGDPHTALTKEVRKLAPGESGLVALDWNNGNRTVLVDPLLTGLLVGQTLHTTAPEIYRALVEATAFGALTIIERFEEYGLAVDEIVNCGGIAEKNDFVMQTFADITGRPMKLSRSGQTCALGAAIFGAVAGGAYEDATAAQAKMTAMRRKVYRPRAKAAKTYAELYAIYRALHDAFGTEGARGRLDRAMKDLIRIRDAARRGSV